MPTGNTGVNIVDLLLVEVQHWWLEPYGPAVATVPGHTANEKKAV